MNMEEKPRERKKRPPMSEHTGRAFGNFLGGMVASIITFLIGLFIKKE